MLIHQHATPKKPERVVLVGARGFIGAAIRRRLEAEAIATLALTSA